VKDSDPLNHWQYWYTKHQHHICETVETYWMCLQLGGLKCAYKCTAS